MSGTNKIDPFVLEVFFAKYEFVAEHLLCCSDAESITMKDLLALGDEEALNLWDNLSLGYTECKGLPQLRAECAKDHPGLDPECTLCFAGAEEGIYCTFKTLLEPSDHAIVVTPCYQSLLSIPDSLCHTSSLDLTHSDGWSLDLTALRALIRPGVSKLIVVNFPHNPTGTIISLAQQGELIAVAREFGLWLFCDEVYRGVERDPTALLPTIASVYEKGISLGAVSKVYGLAGLRLGWICCSDQSLISQVADNKHYLSICNSAPSEILSLIAMRSRATVIGRIQGIIKANEQYLATFMGRYPHLLSWTAPQGGCCGFMKMHLPEGVDLSAVAERLVNEHGVLILPGDNFPITDKASKVLSQHFRIGLGRANFPSVLDAFETALPRVLQDMGVDFGQMFAQ
ncbi:pyridoxal phosphate-dependent transferase [Ochromonadaceae sp. CCMP2298]|nr:pyridoxal phosphate-dependent transferase [Ochromonadaceae sp. CCMP2298]